jgi:hypothetical protein
MPAGSTYTPIATTTLGSAQADVTFNSFSGYTDLVLVANVQLTSAGQSFLYQYNGVTGNSYSFTILKGNGSSASSDRRSNVNYQIGAGWDAGLPTSSSFATVIINIQNYANTSTYKTSVARGSNASGGDLTATVNMWSSTNAITSLRFYSGSGNLNTGSTFTLYGIQAA